MAWVSMILTRNGMGFDDLCVYTPKVFLKQVPEISYTHINNILKMKAIRSSETPVKTYNTTENYHGSCKYIPL
jgi:hypothetical protein